MRENQGWYQEGLAHEQLVKGFQSYINYMRQVDLDVQSHLSADKRKSPSPEAIIRRKLDWESGTIDPEKGEFYSTLRNAWDAVNYERYPIGSSQEHLAGVTLSGYYQHQCVTGAPEPGAIRFTDPVQTRMFDALSDAAGVPHQHGQTAVEIPDKLKNYGPWSRSEEYMDLRKAAAARARREQPEPPSSSHSTTEYTASNQPVEQDPLYAAFWNRFIDQASEVPTGEDPAFWPRKVFLKFEELIENKDFITDKAKHELATKLTPIQESMLKVRTAYEIAAYSSVQRLPIEKEKSFMQGIIEEDLKMDREFRNRNAVELSLAEQALVGRLCKTSRYTGDGRTGQRTLQPQIPFDPDRRIYNYADIIGPGPKPEPPAARRRQPPHRGK
jgi:hypothetical protein